MLYTVLYFQTRYLAAKMKKLTHAEELAQRRRWLSVHSVQIVVNACRTVACILFPQWPMNVAVPDKSIRGQHGSSRHVRAMNKDSRLNTK